MNRVHLCDCMDFMKDKPDNCYDFAIVDPPYGIGADNMTMGSSKPRNGNSKYNNISTAQRLKKNRLNRGSGKLKNRILNKSDCSWDLFPPTKEYFKTLFKISKYQIIFGGNYFDLPPTRCVIAWDKLQPWENFSQWEMIWTSFDKPARMFKYSNTGGNNREKKIHLTQKPVALYKWLLKNYAKPGQTIFDSHVGSGSIRIACYDLGFDFEGCELDKDYWQAQEDRFKNHIQQQELFDKNEYQDLLYRKEKP